MGQDFTSYTYPTSTALTDDSKDEESHQEPASEYVRSAVEGYEHPLFSPKGLKETLNLNRIFSNSSEKPLTKDIDEKLIKEVMQTALKNKVPFDSLIFAIDFSKDLDKSSGSVGAEDIAKKMKGFVDELTSSLGRQPLNSEVLMAFALDGAGKVKSIIDNANEKPNEEATSLGSSKDDQIIKKSKYGQEKKRTNKEVLQYFKKRMGNGNQTFPHTI